MLTFVPNYDRDVNVKSQKGGTPGEAYARQP